MATLFRKLTREQLSRFLPTPDLIRAFEALQDAIVNGSGGAGITQLTGDVTAIGAGSVAATIPNDTVSYAKMQNVSAASKLLGRGQGGGGGDVQEIALGTGLTMVGAVLSAAGAYPKGAAWDASPAGLVVPAGASVQFPAPCQASGTILAAYAIGQTVAGSATVEVWKSAAGVPSVANKISGSNPITLAAATSSIDATLATWTSTAVTAGDRFGFKVLTSSLFSFLGVYLIIG